MMLLRNDPPGLLWLSLCRLPRVICQGLHLLRDPPGALETLESPGDPLQPGLVGPAVGHLTSGMELWAGSVSLLLQALEDAGS